MVTSTATTALSVTNVLGQSGRDRPLKWASIAITATTESMARARDSISGVQLSELVSRREEIVSASEVALLLCNLILRTCVEASLEPALLVLSREIWAALSYWVALLSLLSLDGKA